MRTNQQGRATFDRLGAGRYRVYSTATERCAGQLFLPAARFVALSGSGTVEVRMIVGGRATFRVMSQLGPMKSTLISAAPNELSSPRPFAFPLSTPSGCRGTTDADGRVTLTNFPPEPAHVNVPMGNSTYVR